MNPEHEKRKQRKIKELQRRGFTQKQIDNYMWRWLMPISNPDRRKK